MYITKKQIGSLKNKQRLYAHYQKNKHSTIR